MSEPKRTKTAVNRLGKALESSRQLAAEVGPIRRETVGVGVEDPRASKIIAFLRTTAAAGIEVDPELPAGDRSARESLERLLNDWRCELEALLRRPVVIPPLARYERESLERLDADEIDRLLRQRFPRLQGRHLENILDKLRNADLREASIVECRFEACDLTGASFGSATALSRTAFIRCTLDTVEAGGVTPEVEGDEVMAALDLQMESDASPFGGGLRILSAVFEDCRWDGADFTLASFSNCLFHDMKVRSAARPVILNRAAFSSCKMKGVVFRAILQRAQFTDCDLDGASFRNVELQNAVFNNCTLVGATFNGADLTGVTFCDSDLERADFAGLIGRNFASKPTKLVGTDFSRALNVNPLQIAEGHPDEACQFPAGFDTSGTHVARKADLTAAPEME